MKIEYYLVDDSYEYAADYNSPFRTTDNASFIDIPSVGDELYFHIEGLTANYFSVLHIVRRIYEEDGQDKTNVIGVIVCECIGQETGDAPY
ncbi:hypothetical protein VH1807_contig00015-0201 [Vibrio harveyi]|uniref:hypothetical protein n=1 Tax=Vibrio harveyi TaxID=669 RepID=UPI0010FFAEF5|nr:hypothetical protein [Vibrio harveyi]GEA21473.1 hypothetical protein VH1807_contig00015-0201 [Vibrio harveyi]